VGDPASQKVSSWQHSKKIDRIRSLHKSQNNLYCPDSLYAAAGAVHKGCFAASRQTDVLDCLRPCHIHQTDLAICSQTVNFLSGGRHFDFQIEKLMTDASLKFTKRSQQNNLSVALTEDFSTERFRWAAETKSAAKISHPVKKKTERLVPKLCGGTCLFFEGGKIRGFEG